MQMFRQRKYLFAVAAMVLVFAGCKGESPTAPTSNTPTTTAGGTPPPTSGNITLTVSNPTPQVNSSSIITATVTDSSNQPVANGTAVEFDTNLGTFTEANAQTVIRTTTNGVATITLTSATVGTATVSAIVANVKKTTTVTFSAVPVNPPPPNTTPVISGITPNFGRPQGGEVVTISGKNFRTPLRVLFDFGAGKTPKEATIISSTDSSIQVLTPSVDLGPTAQQLTATIKVINEAGTPNEIVVPGPTFTFQLTILTPKITTFSPISGPFEGGTNVSIYGEGFQSPVLVYFGNPAADPGVKQAQVLHVDYNRIDVVSPSVTASAPAVNLTVINVNSNTRTTSADLWTWVQKSQIFAITPVSGSALGGTTVTINGVGFSDPVTVDIAGVRAQVIKVSGTQILARTTALPSPCTASSGPVVVTNINNGDQATSGAGQAFSYLAINPLITAVTPSGPTPTVGNSVTVTVQDPGIGPLGNAVVSFTIGGTAVAATPQQITTGTGAQQFVMPIPNVTFPTVACTVGSLTGTQLGPTTVEVAFKNVTTGCTASAPNSLTVYPPAPNTCVIPPHATLVSPAQSCPVANLSPASVASGGGSQTATITISNATGAQTLNLGAPVVTPTNGTTLIAPSTAQTVSGGSSVSYTFTIHPTAAGPDGATVTFSTNDPSQPTMTVTLCGSAT